MTLDRLTYPATLHVRDGGDGRTIEGPLLPWGVEARVLDRGRMVVETFQRGALADADPARVPLTATHPRDAGTLPIGRTIELRDEADALHGAWYISATALGARSWPSPATASPSACQSASWRSLGVAAGRPAAAA
jgi:hypothetical protein